MVYEEFRIFSPTSSATGGTPFVPQGTEEHEKAPTNRFTLTAKWIPSICYVCFGCVVIHGLPVKNLVVFPLEPLMSRPARLAMPHIPARSASEEHYHTPHKKKGSELFSSLFAALSPPFPGGRAGGWSGQGPVSWPAVPHPNLNTSQPARQRTLDFPQELAPKAPNREKTAHPAGHANARKTNIDPSDTLHAHTRSGQPASAVAQEKISAPAPAFHDRPGARGTRPRRSGQKLAQKIRRPSGRLVSNSKFQSPFSTPVLRSPRRSRIPNRPPPTCENKNQRKSSHLRRRHKLQTKMKKQLAATTVVLTKITTTHDLSRLLSPIGRASIRNHLVGSPDACSPTSSMPSLYP